jgi:hypothetical protein
MFAVNLGQNLFFLKLEKENVCSQVLVLANTVTMSAANLVIFWEEFGV